MVVAIAVSGAAGYFVGSADRATSTLTSVSTATVTQTVSISAQTTGSRSASNGLELQLDVRPTGNGSYGFEAEEFNNLGTENNVSAADGWAYPEYNLDGFDDCFVYATPHIPVGLAVFQGDYGLNNFTTGRPLALFNTTYVWTCTTTRYSTAYYLFDPMSDSAQAFDSRGTFTGNLTATFSVLTSGYWTGGAGSGGPAFFHEFSGVYTVLAVDEWGGVSIMHFSVMR